MRRKCLWVALIATSLVCSSGHAQLAVIDVGAITRLVAQLRTLEQQLSTARDALRESQNTYAAMTGSRGAERLLPNTERNYLPSTWADVSAAITNAQSAYGALANDLRAAIETNAVLSADELAVFAPLDRELHESRRREVALLQGLTRQALGAISQRFSSLQRLIDAIADTGDPKSIAELNARIGAEQAMLANDAQKLSTLYQVAQAEAAATELRLKEKAITDVGSFRALPPMGLQ